jgi:lipoate-protein ligase A
MAPELRIIIDPTRTAAFNMAADLYLLEQASHGHTVFLRFYTWSPPAISLGCMQKAEETLDLAEMKKHGVDWIRRPTGGRAILHWNDLTYAFVFPIVTPTMGTTINESYAVISRCLMSGHPPTMLRQNGSSNFPAFSRQTVTRSW